MKKRDLHLTELVHRMMGTGKFTQPTLAEYIGTSQPNVSRWLKEGVNAQPELAAKIVRAAEGLGLVESDTPIIKVRGMVGDAGRVMFYTVLGEDALRKIKAPIATTNPKAAALEIRSDSLGPYRESWIAVYDDVRQPLSEDLIGKQSLVALPDQQYYVRRIEPDGKGIKLTEANGGAPIKNPKIMWVSPILGIWYYPERP